MKSEIPQFLIELSKQMNEQDNYGTAHPFFQVRNKRYVITEEDYNEHHWEVYDTDDCEVVYRSDIDENLDDLAFELHEEYKDWCIDFCRTNWSACSNYKSFESLFNDNFDKSYHELPERYRICYMQEVEEVISTHLTEAEADWFIERKKHDYPRAYKWTASAYWSKDIKNLQDWIKSLTENDDK